MRERKIGRNIIKTKRQFWKNFTFIVFLQKNSKPNEEVTGINKIPKKDWLYPNSKTIKPTSK